MDQDGELVDVFLQKRRYRKAAKRFFKRLLKKHQREPRKIGKGGKGDRFIFLFLLPLFSSMDDVAPKNKSVPFTSKLWSSP